MANETKAPDGLLDQTNLSGALTDIDDDPDSPDGLWLTASSNNANSICRVSFPTPTGNPTTGAGLQNFKWWARLTPNGTACTYNVYLYENGTVLNGGAAIATGSLTSTSGQLITATWDATLLGTADGSLVEAQLEVVKSGGAPGARTTGEVGAVEWNVDYTAGVTYVYLAGTCTGASATPAAPLDVTRGLIGTVGATSTTAGAVGLYMSLAGTSAATTTADGLLGILLSLAGSSTGVSNVPAANLSKLWKMQTTGAAGTSATAAAPLSVTRGLVGTSDGVSTTTGTMKMWVGLVGTSDGVSSAFGTLGAGSIIGLIGAVTGTSTASGVAGVYRGLIGTSTASSVVSNALLSRTVGLFSSTAGVSTTQGAISLFLSLKGTCDPFTTSFSTLTIAGQVQLAGYVVAEAVTTGFLRLLISLKGSVSALGWAQVGGDAVVERLNYFIMRMRWKRARTWMAKKRKKKKRRRR